MDHVLTRKQATMLKILESVDRPIEQMTLGEICANADVSRQTFYRHFSSKYDPPYWYIDLAKELYLYPAGGDKPLLHSLENFFEFLYMEQRPMQLALEKMPTEPESVTYERIAAHKESVVSKVKLKGKKINPELEFYIDFYTFHGFYTVIDWCLEGMPVQPDVFAKYYYNCIPRKLAEILEG